MPGGKDRLRPDIQVSRRQIVRTLGIAGVAGLAGCGGDGGDGEATTQPAGDGSDGGDGGDGGDATTTEEEFFGTTEEPTETPTPEGDISMGGELVGTFGADVKSFDPTRQNDTTSTKAFSLVYEGLMAVDWDGEPQPVLAESVEQQSDKTFRFNLRQGVEFHNGKEMTAADVKASLTRYEGTPRESDVYDWLTSDGTIEIIDDYTIDITIGQKYAPLMFAVGAGLVVPKEVADGDLDLTENPVGTGPYTFEEHQPDKLFRISRNDNYWFSGSEGVPETPPIETVTFRVITEQSSQLSAFRSGDVDMINNPPAPSVQDLKDNDEFKVTSRIQGGFDMFIYPSHEAADTPFQNKKVRQGANRLIPRESIIESVYNGIGIPAYSPISPLARQFTSEEFNQEMGEKYAAYDREEANTLLRQGFEEAGYTLPFKTKIITNQNPQRVKWSQLIQESMNQSEFFEVGLEQFEWNTYVGKILAEDSHTNNSLVALGWSAGWDPDAYVNNLFHSSKATPACCNINHYANDEIDQLIDNALQTYDVAERQAAYEEVQRKVVEESPMAFIQFSRGFDVVHPDRVKRFSTYPIDGGEYDSIYAPYGNKFTWVDK
jgi:peptide/nickel transport system substrate-binding protein